MPWFTPARTVADPLPIQQITLRQGDRLSSFAAVIEDEYGVALDLTASQCYLSLRPLSANATEALVQRVEMVVDNAVGGQVSYDWQVSQTIGAPAGVYDVLIDVEYAAGMTITVPSADQAMVVNLRPSIAGDWFAVGDDGALIPDGLGGFIISGDMVLLEDGTPWLLENGDYWLLESA